jgi:hypothetical protein
MNTFEIAIAIFGVVLLAWTVTGTKETASSRLLACRHQPHRADRCRPRGYRLP